ncbi:hypothetical protein D3C72_2330660 [compost metagenome]
MRQAKQQQVDLLLGQAVMATALADIVPLAILRQHFDYFVGHQAVVDDCVGLLQQAPSAQGEQAGIAGAGADQRHAARL